MTDESLGSVGTDLEQLEHYKRELDNERKRAIKAMRKHTEFRLLVQKLIASGAVMSADSVCVSRYFYEQVRDNLGMEDEQDG